MGRPFVGLARGAGPMHPSALCWRAIPRLVRPLALASLLLSLGLPARGQVSPGPLARPHEKLDSTLQCLVCHGQGKASLRERCLACHEEIAWLVQRRLGLHGMEGREDCSRCHEEHAGRDAALIRWEAGGPEGFDHVQAGWPLEGRHASVRCRECHKLEFTVSKAARLSKRRDRGAGWIGLDRECVSCHLDVHRGTLGRDCRKCHDTRAWKPAVEFDHTETDYPLTGKHAQVECNKCHMAPSLALPLDAAGRPTPLYKPLPHGECSACHTDPHGSRLGPACSRCHVTESFARTDPKRFDHDLTRYPLRGRHATLECSQCHDRRTAWGKKPPFATCGSCHSDPHAGQGTIAGKAVDCAACHRVEGFRPSTYTVAEHQRSAYPLEGQHSKVQCAGCHLKNPSRVPVEKLGTARVLLRPAHARCRDCHEDAHGGQLLKRPDQGACESCHTVSGWRPSTFTAKDHAMLKLALEGRHANIKCAACHGPSRKGLPALPGPGKLGSARVALVSLDSACASCHLDPHGGRFGPGGARPKPEGCLACHDVRAFRPSTVDAEAHRAFAYPLEGAHSATPCDACHEDLKAPPSRSSLLLAAGAARPMTLATRSQRCEGCHSSPHGEQFAQRPDRGACESCHGEGAFRPADRFDHDRDARFPLEGVHARVRCDRCHATVTDPSGRAMTIYRPVARECAGCHGKDSPRRAASAVAPFEARARLRPTAGRGGSSRCAAG